MDDKKEEKNDKEIAENYKNYLKLKHKKEQRIKVLKHILKQGLDKNDRDM